jgi:hypothetical protein
LRALHQLLNGHLLTALDLNALMVLSLPFLGYAVLSSVVSAVSARRLPVAPVPAIWVWGLLAVVVAYWALRNIPLYPFSVLAP